jgi:hypothetical protein
MHIVIWRHRHIRYSKLEPQLVYADDPRVVILRSPTLEHITTEHSRCNYHRSINTITVAGHRLNLGKRQRSDVKLLYAEIRQNPLFADNAAFPIGQARFVIWWLSTFPGPIFPTREAVDSAIARQHPEDFDYQNWDPKLLDDAAERLRSANPSSEPQAISSSAQPSRSLADRISVPLRNRITVPLANRITIPLANRITFPADRVNSGRIQKRRGGSRR